MMRHMSTYGRTFNRFFSETKILTSAILAMNELGFFWWW